MYGLALARAIVLLVVDLEVGDVEAVREVIGGEDISLGTETKEAIRHGLAWIHVVTGTITIGYLPVATSLVRETSALHALADAATKDNNSPPSSSD